MFAELHSVCEDDDVWVEYKLGDRFVNIPIEDLCPDCLSPRIEVGEVFGHFEAVSVIEHDKTCIHRRRPLLATGVLYMEMPVGVAITGDEVREILKDYPGYRNDAMRALIKGGLVARVGKKFRRIR